ncbi:hypothetical protein B0H13DRAFT_857242 [Mycena leptocephala]|nr:hypothetical protein B0H13DRAFT_857242 [Mycena leptocephala]
MLSPPHSPRFLATQRRSRSLAPRRQLVVLHFATRPPTQPSANTTLGIESHAQSALPSTAVCGGRQLRISRRHRRDHPQTCLHAPAGPACRQTLVPPPTAFDLLCLADSPTSRCKLMTGFPSLEAGSPITLLSADHIPCDHSPGSTPFSVDICWLVVALVFIQRPNAAIMCVDA